MKAIPIDKKKTKRNLVCELTPEEVKDYSSELARVTSEQERLEDEKRSVTSGYTDKINRCVLDMRTLARKISTGQEMREVDCAWKFDFKTATAKLSRSDTGEVVETRAMTAEELQEKLPMGKEAN